MSRVPINGSFLRLYNRANILNLVRLNQPISRVALAKLTRLSQTAIGSLIADLLDEGYIEETGTGKSRGGRKPILLQLKSNSYFSVGIDIGIQSIRVVVVDLLGVVIFEKLFELDFCSDYSRLMRFIDTTTISIIKNLSIRHDRILGISLAIPGAVSNSARKIFYSPSLGWEDISVPDSFDSLPNIQVVVENDANACAIYEHWLGVCQGVDNFACIVHTIGIGAGVFINGKLNRGSDGISAQIGHIQVDINGPQCRCGNYGCLEVMAADAYSVEKMKKFVRQGITKIGNTNNIDEINIELIQKEALNGNEIALNILMEAATYMGIGISIIVNILNPSKIVFGKGYENIPQIFLDRIVDVVNNKVFRIYKSRFTITKSSSSENAVAVGAAIIPIKSLFGEDFDLCKR